MRRRRDDVFGGSVRAISGLAAAVLLLYLSGCPERRTPEGRARLDDPVVPTVQGQGYLGLSGGNSEIPQNVERLRDDPARGNIRGEFPE